jgi:hypothetical protein
MSYILQELTKLTMTNKASLQPYSVCFVTVAKLMTITGQTHVAKMYISKHDYFSINTGLILLKFSEKKLIYRYGKSGLMTVAFLLTRWFSGLAAYRPEKAPRLAADYAGHSYL